MQNNELLEGEELRPVEESYLYVRAYLYKKG